MTQRNEGKLSRRTFLSAGTAVALSGGAALIFGCGDGGGRPTQTPKPGGVGAPRRGGDIVISRHNAVFTIDPHIDATAPDIAELIYSRLYTWDAVNQIAIFNDLALAVEVPEPQLQEFVFSLRPGVKVHSHLNNPASGEELTSEDCKQSFIRRGSAITAPDKRLALAIGGTGVADSTALAAALQTPDPHTFSFKLARPYISVLREIAKPEWAIVPAKVIDRHGRSFSLGNIAFGSGPSCSRS